MIAAVNYDKQIKLINKKLITFESLRKDFLMRELLAYFIPDDSIIIWDGLVPENGKHDIENIVNNLSGYKRVILDCCSSSRCWKVLENFKVDLPCYATTSIVNYYQTNDKQIKFFPSDLVNMNIMSIDQKINRTREYKFSCLNGNAWSHRQLTYINLFDKPYFNEIIFSWGRKTYRDSILVDDIINDIVLTDSEKQKLTQLPSCISTHEEQRSGNDRTSQHPAFTNACVNIVTETQSRSDTPSLTEKIMKPILTGQFFVLIGQPECISFLRKVGIDVFDDIIDHTYDTVQCDRDRIHQSIAEIDRLATLDLFKLHNDCYDRFVANKDYILSEDFLNKITQMEFNNE